MQDNQEEINLIDYIRLLVKSKKVIFAWLVVGVVFGAGTFLFYQHRTPVQAPKTVYQSEAVIQVGSLTNTMLAEQPVENIDGLVWKINSGIFNQSATLQAVYVPSTMLVDIKSSASNQDDATGALSQTVAKIVTDENNKLNVYKNTAPADIFSTSPAVIVEVPGALAASPAPAAKKFGIVFMVIIGAMLGLFLGVCFVFMNDWWQKNKQYIK